MTNKVNQHFINSALVAGDEIDLECLVTFDDQNRTKIKYDPKKVSNRRAAAGQIRNYPKVISLFSSQQISPIIPINSNNRLDHQLVNMAFENAKLATLFKEREDLLQSRIEDGERLLNEKFHDAYPSFSRLRFALRKVDSGLSVGLIRDNGPNFPVDYRGSGVKKLVTLFVELMTLDPNSEHIYILSDEPENALHADAQHVLRTTLENLATHDSIQVIYATHSSSMINTLKPSRIRLLSLEVQNNGYTVAKVDNNPFGDNFQAVRSNLGITPADSLLFAPISVIVEGETEVSTIDSMLTKLCDAGIKDFTNYGQHRDLIHFIDAVGGGNIKRMCKVVKSQGCFPIIFVDDDDHVKEIRAEFEDVPVVSLDHNQEFEDLVSKEVYFWALAKLNEDENLTEKAFSEWDKKPEGKPSSYKKWKFTSKVRRWLEDTKTEAVITKKSRIMLKAIELIATPEDAKKHIRQPKLMELIKQIQLLASTKL